MASNALPAGSNSWPGGSARWERARLPFSSAALVGAESTPLKASAEDYRGGLPPHGGVAAAVAAAAPAMGRTHRQPTPVFAPSNSFFPSASNGNGSPIETSQVQGGGGNGVRTVWLESEVNRAQHQNLQLQHHITFLNAQMTTQLGHIAALHNKVMTLESELRSLKANVAVASEAVECGASASESAPVDSSAGAGDITSATTLAPPAPSPAADLGQNQPIPDRQRPGAPAPADADAPGVVGKYALWDLRPNGAGGSSATSLASTATGFGAAVSPETGVVEAAAASLPLSPEEVLHAECCSSEQLGDGREAPSPSTDPATSTEAASASASVGTPAGLDGKTSSCGDSSAADGTENVSHIEPDIAEKADDVDEKTSSCNNSGGPVREDASDPGPDVTSNAEPPATALRKPEHSLGDFWANSDDNVVGSFPPSRNTRSRRYRGSADGSPRQQQGGKSTLLDGEDASHGANASAPSPSWALQSAHDEVGMKAPTAEEREPSLVTNAEGAPAQTDQDDRVKAEHTASTKPLTALSSALRRATEGREGAEDRSSHLMDCCFCQDSLPEGESIGRCDACPRSFCTQCLEHSLLEGGMDLETLDRGSRAMLEGKHGDFFIAQCPRCISGCDTNFSPPHGVPPMEHLLNELLRHDLSICFREPVDIINHPDYIEAIGRDSMMDLGTMLSKLKRKKYPRRRGPGQFMEDLNRVWRNCRKFAGCDELGKPHYGTTVPGIVRCALTLEAMQRKFCAAYPVADDEGQAWQESTWSFHRQRLERANAEARLKQLERPGNKVKEEKPSLSAVHGAGVAAGAGQEGKEESSNSRSTAVETRGGGGSTGSPSTQQHAEAEARAGGRKRRAPAGERAAQEGSLKRSLTRSGAERVALPGASVRSSQASGTPTIVRGTAGIKQEQLPWSALDKLCDLASSFVK